MTDEMGSSERPAGQKITLLVRNQQEREITFVLEPYGLSYDMPPGTVFELRAEGPPGDDLEIDFEAEEIIAWAWAGSVAEVYHNDVPFSPGPPHPVPTALPEGMSTRGFLRTIMGERQEQEPE